MSTELHWVNGPWRGKLALSSRPRGGDWLEDEMSAWRRAGIDVVVSLLERTESFDLALDGEEQEAEKQGMEFKSLPITDRQVPLLRGAFIRQVESLDRNLENGKNMVLHCRQGIGRTGLVAACLLLLRGVSSSEAVELLSAARGLPVPETAEQRVWLDEFAANFELAR